MSQDQGLQELFGFLEKATPIVGMVTGTNKMFPSAFVSHWSISLFGDFWNLVNSTHKENGGTLGMVPLINPINTLYSGHLLGISPFKRLLGGLNS